MKKIGIVITFVLLVATMAAGFYFFQKNQAGAKELIDSTRRLNDVKQAFEERGRLLVDLKKSADDAKEQAKKVGADYEKAMADLESNRALKKQNDELAETLDTLMKNLEGTQKQLAESHKQSESVKAKGREDQGKLDKQNSDIRSLEDQLGAANKKLKEMEGVLDSQKLLLQSKANAIKKYADLGMSPSDIRDLLKEYNFLKGAIPSALGRSGVPAGTKVQGEKLPVTLNSLPFGLKLPLPDKRLTKPLKEK